ncbi:hypothetical protein [Pontibacter liquoris]|uniref:hypothetical protein n=1 Tax=Pontibacter liquoris TaxID=2905677 RepID=UPI001FA729EA|nr:hypothetical protein [Pontibacter liquoris]
MIELEELAARLSNSNLLLLKENNTYLECQFVTGGLVCHVVPVRNKILAQALQQKSIRGIIEGTHYLSFQNNFSSFCLHVRARVLYAELRASTAEYQLSYPQLAVA